MRRFIHQDLGRLSSSEPSHLRSASNLVAGKNVTRQIETVGGPVDPDARADRLLSRNRRVNLISSKGITGEQHTCRMLLVVTSTCEDEDDKDRVPNVHYLLGGVSHVQAFYLNKPAICAGCTSA